MAGSSALTGRRVLFVAALACAVPLALIAMVILGTLGACSCAQPAPTGTPLPVSSETASETGKRFVEGPGPSSPSITTTLEASANGRMGTVTVYVVSGDLGVATVDAVAGTVLRAVLVDAIPASRDVIVSAKEARDAAGAFLSSRGVATDGMAAGAASLDDQGSTCAYTVGWTVAGAGGSPGVGGGAAAGLEVDVNPQTGDVFAFSDLRSGIRFTLPGIGLAAAGALAADALVLPGAKILSAAFNLDYKAQEWPNWFIQLTAADPNVNHGGEVRGGTRRPGR